MSTLINPQRLATYAAFPGGYPVPVVIGTGTRVNATAAVASTAEAQIPAGGSVLMIRATAGIWIRFGTTGMGAAAADANSILFVAGEAPYVVQPGQTHFRVLRVGDADVPMQLESVSTLS